MKVAPLVTYITYQWGPNLQIPGIIWRVAFEAAISDWHWAPTFLYFTYSSTGDVVFDTVYDVQGPGGYTAWVCSGSIAIEAYAYGNLAKDPGDPILRHSMAGHETGHTEFIGHIADSAGTALMGHNPDPSRYYTPQYVDVALVNQVYP